MRATVSIPDTLLEAATEVAAARGLTLSTLVEQGLRLVLGAPPSSGSPEFKLHTVGGPALSSGYDLSRTSALLTADDERQFTRPRAGV